MALTDQQADRLAQRLWGKRGRAWHPLNDVPGGVGYCVVGVTDGTKALHRWTPHGVGSSWEEAFTDADDRGFGLRQDSEPSEGG